MNTRTTPRSNFNNQRDILLRRVGPLYDVDDLIEIEVPGKLSLCDCHHAGRHGEAGRSCYDFSESNIRIIARDGEALHRQILGGDVLDRR